MVAVSYISIIERHDEYQNAIRELLGSISPGLDQTRPCSDPALLAAIRRTITRFVEAILIAVSIEALLMMFKSALGEPDHMLEAVWMMLAAIGLLGICVYLGTQAEVALRTQRSVGR